MPLSKKDLDMKSNFTKEYGDRGESVYYATLNKHINKGKPINTPESHRLAKKRKHHKRKKKSHRMY